MVACNKLEVCANSEVQDYLFADLKSFWDQLISLKLSECTYAPLLAHPSFNADTAMEVQGENLNILNNTCTPIEVPRYLPTLKYGNTAISYPVPAALT